VDYSEFEVVLEQTRRARPGWFEEFEGWRSSEAEIAHIEVDLGIILPASYRRFMASVGGGGFGFLDILPLGQREGSVEDFYSVNRRRWWTVDFVAFSPVGTGDLWGFMVEGGVCVDRVAFLDHETGGVIIESEDFLEFLAVKALKP